MFRQYHDGDFFCRNFVTCIKPMLVCVIMKYACIALLKEFTSNAVSGIDVPTSKIPAVIDNTMN